MSYCQISWNLKVGRLIVIIIVSLCNLTGISAALPRCPSNFRATGKVWTRISWLQDFTRSCGKMSVHFGNRGSGVPWFLLPYQVSPSLQQDICHVSVAILTGVGQGRVPGARLGVHLGIWNERHMLFVEHKYNIQSSAAITRFLGSKKSIAL